MTPLNDKKKQLVQSAGQLLQELATKSAASLMEVALIAAGSYGVVYQLPASSPLLTHLNHVVGFKIQNKNNMRTNRLLTEAAGRGDNLVLKLSKVRETPMQNGRPAYDYFNGFIRENVIHISLSHKRFCSIVGADIVPHFYFSGAVKAKDGGMWYVTVMQRANGATLRSVLSSRQDGAMTASEYVKVERAIMRLWLLGVVHADLHMSNVMFDPSSGKVTILDFGFAVPLPEDVIRLMRSNKNLLQDVDGDEIYSGMHKYVHNTVHRRISSIKQFNTDGALLQRLRKLVSDPEHIPQARQEEGSLCPRKKLG